VLCVLCVLCAKQVCFRSVIVVIVVCAVCAVCAVCKTGVFFVCSLFLVPKLLASELSLFFGDKRQQCLAAL